MFVQYQFQLIQILFSLDIIEIGLFRCRGRFIHGYDLNWKKIFRKIAGREV
jgi:hypothetical protein